MRKVYTFENQPEHAYYVNEVHYEYKRVVELCCSELCR